MASRGYSDYFPMSGDPPSGGAYKNPRKWAMYLNEVVLPQMMGGMWYQQLQNLQRRGMPELPDVRETGIRDVARVRRQIASQQQMGQEATNRAFRQMGPAGSGMQVGALRNLQLSLASMGIDAENDVALQNAIREYSRAQSERNYALGIMSGQPGLASAPGESYRWSKQFREQTSGGNGWGGVLGGILGNFAGALPGVIWG